MQPRDKDSINWAECQNNPIDINFHFQNLIQQEQGDKNGIIDG